MTIYRVSIKSNGKTATEKFFKDCDMALDYFDKQCREYKVPTVTEKEYFDNEGIVIRHIGSFTTLEFTTLMCCHSIVGMELR